MAYSTANENVFMVEGFEVSFFYYKYHYGVYTLTVVSYLRLYYSPPSSPTPALRLTVRRVGQLSV